ncbi:uncharacterized protein C1orf87-like [Montipora capricornis]|uniref:uncharacterized protein C1orf87-like n=1 Tax=Montipora capricornis TaxID=246305 RepID=UPI0035F14E48
MAGLAPFGRDDQPLLEVKIIGGKRVEIAVDKYGKPLNDQSTSINLQGSRFQGQQALRSSSVLSASSSGSSSTISAPSKSNHNNTPPRKILKSQDGPELAIDLRSSSGLEGSRVRKFSSPNSSPVLPPIKKKPVIDSDKASGLASKVGSVLLGFDTLKLRDAYLNFAGFDSTLSGFVSADQIEREFFRLQIPVRGDLLNEVLSLFMSAHRPNWINYEQLLKFLSNSVRPTATREFQMSQQIDMSSNPSNRPRQKISKDSPRETTLPLKPNQVSPRADEMQKGRQSAIAMKKAFQDKKDTELLLQMEQLLKDIDYSQELVQTLRRTLEEDNIAGEEFLSSQKLKKICVQHHVPFNNSLMDMIVDRLDKYNSGKVSWVEFLSFIERALPLPAPDTAFSHSRDGRRDLETPPSRPVWETRQPLNSVKQERRYPLRNNSLGSEDLYRKQDDQGVILAKHMEERKKAGTLNLKERDSQVMHLRQGITERTNNGDYTMAEEPQENPKQLEERRDELMRWQQELIEQKRLVQKEQKEIEMIIQNQKEKLYGIDRDNEQTLYVEEESKVKRFMKLANALYVCDQNQSGLIFIDEARRLLNNYNLVNQLDFSADLIENSLRTCSTTDNKVSVDDLIDELKGHL